MKRLVYGTARQILWALLYGGVGGLIVAVAVLVTILESRPDLQAWHTVQLDEEFRAGSEVASFPDFLALEARLQAELERAVYVEGPVGSGGELNRYTRGSLSDPGNWPQNWNRTFELPSSRPAAGVLLLHGMSDSPYSMRSLAEVVHNAGAWTVGMRLPGHGMAPSGLVDVEWQDMAAAVQIAARHVHEKSAGEPFVIVGYSNGGALAVEYALEALADPALPLPTQLVLLSPEIGITRLAGLAVWQERLGHVLGLEKLAWNSILPEYDPFKYGSFALNAGKQAHLITEEIQRRLGALDDGDTLERFPPTLAFQSAADATVTASALVSGLFDRLPNDGNELVVFDVNRFAELEPIMKHDPRSWLEAMLARAEHSYGVTVVTNESPQTLRVSTDRREAGASGVEHETMPGMAWPDDVYSLSHVSLPFPPDDPLYGGPDAEPGPGLQLGELAFRGEKGVLQVTGDDMLRLRWNPFHGYIEARVRQLIGGEPAGRDALGRP